MNDQVLPLQTKSAAALGASVREHLSSSDSQAAALRDFTAQMVDATGKKQEEALGDARKSHHARSDRIDRIEEKISLKTKVPNCTG